ncbi:hypothetical protein AciM339_0600 [Aciduliprofundum sp. MAR08-339]|uniref:AAA family ATPase n=1 Tax=Aciduliprofundum sp. (strain MAR08-339) TaxID=673860 RepID=UPI0002A4835B|nr:hypothetical protein AciM339_0600 [Aciduliprofundum sp. MAR08-339]
MTRGYLNNRQKILLHLSQYSKDIDDILAPKSVTQDGIAKAIGIGRNNVPREIKKLMVSGFVRSKKLHVNGLRNKRTVYFLTERGMEESNKIKRDLKKLKITVIKPSGEREPMILKDACDKYNLSFIQCALNLDKNKNLNLIYLNKKIGGAYHSIDENLILRDFYGREEELKILRNWINSNKKILLMAGISGIGKTTLLLKFVKEYLKDRDVLFIKIESWGGVENIAHKISKFLSKIGAPKMERYLKQLPFSEDRKYEWNNILLLIRESLKNEIFIFDNVENCDENSKNFIRKIVDMVDSSKDFRVILSGTKIEDVVPISKLEYVEEIKLGEIDERDALKMLIQKGFSKDDALEVLSKYGANPLILKILSNGNYGMVRKFIFEGILKSLDKAEAEALSFISVLRKKFKLSMLLLNNIEYQTIYSLINKNILVEMEYETLSTHRSIRNFVYEHLTERKREAYHIMAAKYYEDKDVLEAVYHYARAGKTMRATMLLEENYEKYLFKRGGEIRKLAQYILNRYDDLTKEQEWQLYGIIGDTYDFAGMWEEALENYKKARSLSHKGDVEFNAKVSVKIADILGKKGKYTEASKIIKEVLKKITKIENKKIISQAYYVLGIINMKKGNTEDAKEYMLEAVKFAEQESDTESLGYAYNGLGIIEGFNKNYENAIILFEKSAEYFESCGNLPGLAKVNKNIGLVYYNLCDDRAEKYFRKTMKISEEIGDKWTLAHSYISMANWNMYKEKFFEVKVYLDRALKIFEKLNDLENLSYTYNSLGVFYAYLGDKERGKEFFDRAINLAAQIGNKRAIIEISKDAAKYLRKYGYAYIEDYEKIANGEKKVVAIVDL